MMKTFDRLPGLSAQLTERMARSALRILCSALGSSFLRRVCFPSHVEAVRQFVKVTGIGGDVSDYERYSIVTHLLRRRLLKYLKVHRELPPWNVESTRTVNRTILEEAVTAGDGVMIIVFHSVLDPFIFPLLKTLTTADLQFIGGQEIREHVAAMAPTKNTRLFFAGQMLRAAQTLQNGGMVAVSPDGLHGESGREFRFLNRCRDFQPGFAELALHTRARLVPVDLTLEADGSFRLQFFREFRVDRKNVDCHETRVAELISEYVAWVSERWTNNPGNVRLQKIRQHLALPPVTDETVPPKRVAG
ncbi:MAG: hypothetical protein ABGZ53_16400 [Fuerstiella sp.]